MLSKLFRRSQFEVIEADRSPQNAVWERMLHPPGGGERSLSMVQDRLSNAGSGEGKMKVTFTDPMTSGCLIAQVSPTKTASECIQALKSNGLLGPGDYHLVVDEKAVPPNQTLGEAGVHEGGTVAIHRMEQGA